MVVRHKILILDPSPIFRRTLKGVIETSEAHVEVLEAEDSDQAKSIMAKDFPAIVFIDIALPGKKGFTFIEEVKHLSPETRVVVLTSHDSAEHESASLEHGADLFFSKERSSGLLLLDVIRSAVRQEGDA